VKNPEVFVPVYRHNARSEWGAALLTWERDNKRGYLFEDGVHRVIAEPFFHLMRLAPVEEAELSNVFRQHISRMSAANTAGVLDPSRGASTMFSIDEQAGLLLGLFPEGFAGKRWRARHRGVGAKKPLKRHRDPCISAVQEALAAPRLSAAIAEGSAPKFWADLVTLLETTDLAPPAEVKALTQRVDRADRGLLVALAALLAPEAAAEDEFKKHFSSYVTALTKMLGRTPSWQLATSILALHSPTRYLCVHTTSLGRQRTWMGDSPIRARKPNAVDYQKALTTAERMQKELQPLGLEPTDLLDLYDFMRTSTTPSAMRRLQALRQSALRAAAGEQPQDATVPATASSPTASEPGVTEEAA
jgi:hypothetical protein